MDRSQWRGRGGGRGHSGHGGRGGRGGWTKPRRPQLNPMAFVDTRYAMQPLPEFGTPASDGVNEDTFVSHNFPPTYAKRHHATEFVQDRRYFCDRCFRGYNTAFYYQLHLKNHVQCVADGCSFSALPRVVAKHLLTVHSHMGAGSSDPSKSTVDKWVNARKRNFPSKETLESKREREEEMMERGEILETRNEFGKFKLASIKGPSKKNRVEQNCSEDDSATNEHSTVHKETTKQQNVGTVELIEKLLAKEIQQERNMLLQCIRYMVSNGHEFGISENRDAKKSDGE